DLQEIGKDAIMFDSPICDLKNLKTIGGNAVFNDKITSFKNLQTIGGYANLTDIKVINLGKLQIIKGKCIVLPEQTDLIEKLKERNIEFQYPES
ncbi:hypothetical protein IJS77_01215, partial [bacterium]|nr:hypothetical protein [bacterium]